MRLLSRSLSDISLCGLLLYVRSFLDIIDREKHLSNRLNDDYAWGL
jgi:hypothetical protein